MFLTEKYKPKKFSEFIGNEKIVSFVKEWASKWQKNQKQKPLLFFGPPGIGKTSLAYVIAKENNWQVIELNASDIRNKQCMQEFLLPAVSNVGLFGRKLILIDEIDALSKTDRGFLADMEKLIQSSNNPIIFTANKIYFKNKSLANLQKLTIPLEFKKISKSVIASFLKKICDAENIDYDIISISKLAELCNSDIRALLLDLQTATALNKKLTLEDISSLDYREREQKIFLLLNKIFKTKNLEEIRILRNSVDIDYELLKYWVEENIPNAYYNEDLQKSFDMLSRADIYDGRIFKRQYYTFLRYSYEFTTCGVALAKTKAKEGWLKMQFPKFLKSRFKPESLALKLAEEFNLPLKRFLSRDYAFLKQYYEKINTS